MTDASPAQQGPTSMTRRGFIVHVGAAAALLGVPIQPEDKKMILDYLAKQLGP